MPARPAVAQHPGGTWGKAEQIPGTATLNTLPSSVTTLTPVLGILPSLSIGVGWTR